MLLLEPLFRMSIWNWEDFVGIQNVSEIFDGMMIIQNKLSNPSHEIVQEDIDLLNSLVSRFERGDI